MITVSELLAKANDNRLFRERLDAMLGDGWDQDGARTVRVEFVDEDRDCKFAIILVELMRRSVESDRRRWRVMHRAGDYFIHST